MKENPPALIRYPLNMIHKPKVSSSTYDMEYFRRTSEQAGVCVKTTHPLWRRWVKIIRKYKPQGILLDAGCGEGYFLHYAERYFQTHGIDLSEYGIRETCSRATRSALHIGGITHMGYKDSIFDVVTSFDVLEHLDNPESAIRECRRILKRDGILVIREPNTSSIGRRLKKGKWFGYRDRTHVSLLSKDEWLCMLRKNDFEVRDVIYDGLWDIPYVPHIPRLLQTIFIKYLTFMLFMAGAKFLPGYGENLCIISRRG
ncbi:MAG TPA: class I SAM-dependent methyltransferase [Candidatus Methanoperedenaceae archaeon]|nr:class I SAM-dependent methyltransferase [Candidatus Methanoperedenaceae archaeon]